MNPIRGLKRLSRMVFRDQATRWFGWGWGGARTKADMHYERHVGDGTGSSTVMAPLNWIVRNFPEAPPALWKKNPDGQEEQIRRHPMLDLLERPNQFHTGTVHWMATMMDYTVDGNAYWLKLRRRGSNVPAELWWVPHWLIEPKREGSDYISYYLYTPGTREERIDPADVVHFRFGLDPDNDMKGYSSLKSVLREVFTDDEAARFTAALLKNMGVPGLVVSPDGEFTPSQQDVDATKEYLRTAFTEDKRGEPLVMSGPTKIAQFGFSPEQLLLKELRRIPEERVTAVFGIPAVVAGLGAGLDRSTFTNMAEAREAAYEEGIVPRQRILAEDVRFQLLNEFETDVRGFRFGFDLSKVKVLQDDQDKLLRRVDVGVRGGWLPVSYAQRAVGFEPLDGSEVYLRQVNLVEVPVDGSEIRPMAPTPDPAADPAQQNGNGNGHDGQQIAEEVVRAMERQMRSLEVAVTKSQPVVNFHENAFAPPAVTVEAAKAPDVTVEPKITVQPLDLGPLSKVLAKNGNGKQPIKKVTFSDGRTATIEADDG